MTKHPSTQARKNDEVRMPNILLVLGVLPLVFKYFGFLSDFRLRVSRYAATRGYFVIRASFGFGYFVIRISGRIPPTEHTLLIHRGMTDGSDMRPRSGGSLLRILKEL